MATNHDNKTPKLFNSEGQHMIKMIKPGSPIYQKKMARNLKPVTLIKHSTNTLIFFLNTGKNLAWGIISIDMPIHL